MTILAKAVTKEQAAQGASGYIIGSEKNIDTTQALQQSYGYSSGDASGAGKPKEIVVTPKSQTDVSQGVRPLTSEEAQQPHELLIYRTPYAQQIAKQNQIETAQALYAKRMIANVPFSQKAYSKFQPQLKTVEANIYAERYMPLSNEVLSKPILNIKKGRVEYSVGLQEGDGNGRDNNISSDSIINRNTNITKQAKTKGFEERIQDLLKRDTEFYSGVGFKRIEKISPLISKIFSPLLYKIAPDFTSKTFSTAMSSGIALLPTVISAEQKILAAGEAMFYPETRRNILPYFTTAAVQTGQYLISNIPEVAFQSLFFGMFGAGLNKGEVTKVKTTEGVVKPTIKQVPKPIEFNIELKSEEPIVMLEKASAAIKKPFEIIQSKVQELKTNIATSKPINTLRINLVKIEEAQQAAGRVLTQTSAVNVARIGKPFFETKLFVSENIVKPIKDIFIGNKGYEQLRQYNAGVAKAQALATARNEQILSQTRFNMLKQNLIEPITSKIEAIKTNIATSKPINTLRINLVKIEEAQQAAGRVLTQTSAVNVARIGKPFFETKLFVSENIVKPIKDIFIGNKGYEQLRQYNAGVAKAQALATARNEQILAKARFGMPFYETNLKFQEAVVNPLREWGKMNRNIYTNINDNVRINLFNNPRTYTKVGTLSIGDRIKINILSRSKQEVLPSEPIRAIGYAQRKPLKVLNYVELKSLMGKYTEKLKLESGKEIVRTFVYDKPRTYTEPLFYAEKGGISKIKLPVVTKIEQTPKPTTRPIETLSGSNELILIGKEVVKPKPKVEVKSQQLKSIFDDLLQDKLEPKATIDKFSGKTKLTKVFTTLMEAGNFKSLSSFGLSPQSTGSKLDEALRSKFAPKIESKPQNNQNQILSPNLMIIPQEEVTQITSPNQIITPKQITTPQEEVIQITQPIQITLPIQEQVPYQDILQIQRTEQIPKQSEPLIPLLSQKQYQRQTSQSKQSQILNQAYDVYIRRGIKRGNRFVRVAQGLQRNRALQSGMDITDNYVETTFRIVPTKKKAKQPDIMSPPNLYKYRQPLPKSKLPRDSYVEKDAYRIDTQGEQKGLSYFRKRSKKSKGGYSWI